MIITDLAGSTPAPGTMTLYKEDGTSYGDDELKSMNWWKKLLGFGNVRTIQGAVARAGLRPIEGSPRYGNQPNQLLLPVRSFAEILRGFQMVQPRLDGHIHHPWVQGVNTTASDITVTLNNRTLRYIKD